LFEVFFLKIMFVILFLGYDPVWDLFIIPDEPSCGQAPENTFRISTPRIFNRDSGSQFISPQFLRVLE
jgi:hypothetical protein